MRSGLALRFLVKDQNKRSSEYVVVYQFSA
jgi:hypothetical protein